jgi:hypothetical protein
MSITWWFFIGVLVVIVVLACWKFYRSRHPKPGPIRSRRPTQLSTNTKYDRPPNMP